jgi:hypothetical protein
MQEFFHVHVWGSEVSLLSHVKQISARIVKETYVLWLVSRKLFRYFQQDNWPTFGFKNVIGVKHHIDRLRRKFATTAKLDKSRHKQLTTGYTVGEHAAE